MSDNKDKRGGNDRKRVSLEEDYEVQFWTTRLGASRAELEDAIESVGNDADKIREHLAGKKLDKDFDRDRS